MAKFIKSSTIWLDKISLPDTKSKSLIIKGLDFFYAPIKLVVKAQKLTKSLTIQPKTMINLPFSCNCSELKVVPNNWLNKNPSTKKDWYVFYRFYDPNFRDNPKYKNGKLVIIKRMNQFKTILERQESTQLIIEQELSKLKNKAFNPITNKNTGIVLPQMEIESSTSFITALTMAEKRISASPSTKRDLRSVLRYVSKAAGQLRYSDLPISIISRKHIKQILAQIDLTNGESAHRYNKIRSYLMILYKELIELETVEVNPLRDLSKKKSIQRIRKLPSNENRQIINEYLQEHQYRFWIFMQIFFHSGARLTELMKVKRSEIHMNEQYFIITIKKGRVFKEVKRPIKNIALQYWEKAIESAHSGKSGDVDHLFPVQTDHPKLTSLKLS